MTTAPREWAFLSRDAARDRGIYASCGCPGDALSGLGAYKDWVQRWIAHSMGVIATACQAAGSASVCLLFLQAPRGSGSNLEFAHRHELARRTHMLSGGKIRIFRFAIISQRDWAEYLGLTIEQVRAEYDASSSGEGTGRLPPPHIVRAIHPTGVDRDARS